jgi:formate hydrogenlyase transcriptional activator
MLTAESQLRENKTSYPWNIENEESARRLSLAAVTDRSLPVDAAELCRQLAHERDRLSLLLDLTNRVAANLDLHEVLRAVSGTLRHALGCDGGVAMVLFPDGAGPDAARIDGNGDKPWIYTLDFAESERFVSEELLAPGDGLGRQALATLKPVLAKRRDATTPDERHVCCIPLVSRGRALGLLGLVRRRENLFGQFGEDDATFLGQVGSQIAIAIENALAFREISGLKDKLAQENLYLEEEHSSEIAFEHIVGKSAALRGVLELVQTVAPSDSTVLVLGETGTGKELIARAIRDHSRRKDRAFVKLNCAAIPTGLLESELFGHEKGAFTGAITHRIGRLELADQGTLFLDEVGDIPLEIQPKLLHTLQEREFERLGSTQTRKVNLRLVAATNCDLKAMVEARAFRSDLYYRLNVFPIHVPPLRERREDIPLLVRYFAERFARQMQKPIQTIPSAALKRLAAWDWPGNIRELQNFVERAVILTRGKALEFPLTELCRANGDSATQSPSAERRRTNGRDEMEQIVRETIHQLNGKAPDPEAARELEAERQRIVDVLRETNGRVGGPRGAAFRMGVNRTTLLSRMKKLAIRPKQFA